MGIRLSNNAQTTLSSAISATDTSITVVDGSVFPALSGSDYTYVTLEDTSGNLEIVKVTAISSNTLTVTRGQDSTTARAFSSGDFVQLRVTAALLNDLSDEASVTLWADIQNKPDSVITLAGDASGSATMTDLGSATLTVTIADDSHNHVISNVDGLQTALDGKVDLAGDTMTGNLGVGISPNNRLHVYHPTTNVVARFESGDSDVWIDLHDSNSGNYGALIGHNSSMLFRVADASVNDRMTLNNSGLLNTDAGYAVGGTTRINNVGDGLFTSLYIGSTNIVDTSRNLTNIGTISSGAITSTGTSTFAGIRVNNANTALSQGNGNAVRITTNSGYVDVGPMNTSYTHFQTDRANFYFAQTVHFDGQIYNYVGGNTSDPYWRAGNDGSGSGLDADLLDGLHETSFVRTSSGNSSNLNSEYRAGMTSYITNTTGAPVSGAYGQVLNIVSNGASHNNSSNWITQLAFGTNTNTAYFRGKTNAGSWGSWYTLFHTGNDGSGSGLDADLLDGVQATSFLRSDGSDIFTGDYLRFNDNKVLRFGDDGDFRIWHDGNNTAFRNYKHGSNTYLQGEDTAGVNHAFIYLRGDTTAPYVQMFGDGSETFRTKTGGVKVTGEAEAPVIFINRQGNTASGINWYGSTYKAWSMYMAPPGASMGPNGDITAPSGTLVTSWAQRSFIEQNAGYGWTFEKGSATGNPTVVAEIRSSDGAARFGGSVTSLGTVTAGTMRVTSGDGEGYGFWSSALGGAYRIYMSSAANSTYGGRVDRETTSDYNMYFKMQSGTNRGFVFRDDANNYASINPNGIYSEVPFILDNSDTAHIQIKNASYATQLYIGGWTTANSNNISRIRNSSGNLHIDSAANGNLYLNHYSSGVVYARGNTVWHAGNDGSGSGLDADLFDGLNSASYFKKGSDIPGGQNLNSYTSNGFFHQNANSQAQSGSNYPSGNAGMLSVTADGVMVYQTYHQYNGNAYYHRSYYNGTWYPWRKVWTDGNDGSGSGLDADTCDGQHLGTSASVTFNRVQASRMGVTNTSSTSKYGFSLYNGYAEATNPTYGLMFTGTSGSGTHGSVSGDWATYFTMNGTSGRGWIFRNQSTPANVASISNAGYLTATRLYAGDGTDGYFYSDSGGRTAFRSGDFYFMNTVSNFYNYATNQYYGDNSGDSIRFRGNTLSGNGWSLSGGGNFAMGGVIRRNAHNAGHLEGGHNNLGSTANKTSPIYTIGSSYNPNEGSLGNMYGIGYSHTNASFIGFAGTSGWGMYVAADGDARIFLSGQTGHSYFTGNVTAYASDRRLKKNIQTIDRALEKVSRIRGVEFDWVDDIATEYDFHPEQMHETGVIAQEIQSVIEDAVVEAPMNANYAAKSGTDHKFLTVDKSKIVPLLIEAIKELKAEVDDLKAKLEGG